MIGRLAIEGRALRQQSLDLVLERLIGERGACLRRQLIATNPRLVFFQHIKHAGAQGLAARDLDLQLNRMNFEGAHRRAFRTDACRAVGAGRGRFVRRVAERFEERRGPVMRREGRPQTQMGTQERPGKPAGVPRAQALG